jgi:hypothetical protein
MPEEFNKVLKFLEAILAVASPFFIVWALINQNYRNNLDLPRVLLLASAFILFLSLGSVLEWIKELVGFENEIAIQILDGLLFVHFIFIASIILLVGMFALPYTVVIVANVIRNFACSLGIFSCI